MKKFFQIPGYSDCSINENGLVLNTKTNKVTRPWFDSHTGSFRTCMKVNDKLVYFQVYRLLAMVFVPNPENKPLVCFKDDNKENISISNLFWSTHKELQDKAFSIKLQRFKQKYGLPDFKSQSGFYYDELKECKDKPGYFFIPFTKLPIVVNREGRLFNLENQEEHPVSIDKKGYLSTDMYSDSVEKMRKHRVHRIVASVFIPPTDKHSNCRSGDLQVNHINGNKQDNSVNNLEWADGFENMDHARNTGLFRNQIAVLTKNLLTGDVRRFRSVSACGVAFNTSVGNIGEHLNSIYSGRVPIFGHLFKIDDGRDWPEVFENYDMNEAAKYSGYYVAENKQLGKSVIFSCYKSAVEKLGFILYKVNNHRTRKGNDVPYNGWVFKLLADVLHYSEI